MSIQLPEFAIDTEFKSLIPPIAPDEYVQLEKNIRLEGCRDALVTWNSILLDGHNRYKICQEHNIEFTVTERQFEDRTAAKEWIIRNQFARRNICLYERGRLALKLEDIFKTRAKARQREHGGTAPGRTLTPTLAEVLPADTREELAKIASISHGTLSKIKKIEQLATPEQKGKLSQSDVSINQVFKQLVKKERAKTRKETLQTKELPDDIFQVIYCDPPWQYQNSGFETSAEKHYKTMSVEELKELKVQSLADENCVIFMWATNPFLKEAIELMNHYGFIYKTNLVWIKKKHLAGFYVFGQHELLLIGTKGSMLPIGKKPKSIIEGENKLHSKKPEITYEIIEKMYPGLKYVELFLRGKPYKGWQGWGNESWGSEI